MLRPQKPEAEQPQPLGLLRREDQAVIGLLTMCAIAGLALLWYSRGGPSGNLVSYDDLKRGEICFQTDINQADWPELSELSGVGPTLAKRIIEHRTSHGPFRTVEDLRSVRGIGPKILERIRPQLAPLEEGRRMSRPEVAR